LGATRRMEGLAEAVHAVEPRSCESDLEALILEEREIRRLQPRYNTARRIHARPTWIRLPPEPKPVRGKRRLAPPRLQLRSGPAADGGHYLGPFRNSHLAETARNLARALFRLDESRRRDAADVYRERLQSAWQFLNGNTERGLAEVHSALSRATSERDHGASRRWRGLLARARAYDPQQLLLPADPRHARYAVVRPHPEGVEGFVLNKGVLVAHGVSDGSDPEAFAQELAEGSRPRTDPADVELVLRWLGAQHDAGGKEARSIPRVLHVPDDAAAATQVIRDAATAVLAEQAARCAPVIADEAAPV
jgi:hypothetical protein